MTRLEELKICKPPINKTFIYTLEDTKGNIRYIGRTELSLRERFENHLKKRNYSNDHKNNWIKLLFNNNQKPIIKLLDIVNTNEQDYWEDFYIDLFKSWNFDLTNSLKSKYSGKRHSDETKLKISLALKGKKQSEETKLKRKLSSIETWKNEELRKLKSIQTSNLNRLGITGLKNKKLTIDNNGQRTWKKIY